MNLWGKIVGTFIGYLLGGEVGAIFGLLLGHFADQGFTLFQTPAFMKVDARELETIAPEFFTALFSVMGSVANADGRNGGDVGAVLAVMNQIGIPMDYRQEVVQLYRSGFSPDFSMHRMVGQFYIDSAEQTQLFEIFVELQLLAAYNDGKLSAAEKQNIQSICYQLELSSADFAKMDRLVRAVSKKRKAKASTHAANDNTSAVNEAGTESRLHEKLRRSTVKNGKKKEKKRGSAPVERRNLERAFAILNVAQSATNDDIVRAYRRLTSRHHPDKLIAKGMPDEVLKVAEAKTREIRKAYDHIRAVRNF